jgi:hypothetical protein
MKIKIISCIDNHFWYRFLVGQIVECAYIESGGERIGEALVTNVGLTKEQRAISTSYVTGFGSGYINRLDFITLDVVREEKLVLLGI